MDNKTGNRILKNTLMLYSRQILILLVSLYTVRVVLSVLGVEDFGIYNVVGGVVLFFSFLSGSMSSATQRFFSFALGKNDLQELKKIFTVNLFIYLFIAIISIVVLETLGRWFINEYLIIPIERLEAVKELYRYSVLTFVTSIFAAPLMSIIIAHEDMHFYAWISIIEVILKLVVVYLLDHSGWDKLSLYGLLLLCVGIINLLAYAIICWVKYEECRVKDIVIDRTMLYEIASFTGWTLFGQLTTVFRTHGVTILFNQMFNPTVVASRVIATSIAMKVNLFSNSFNVGLYPPIVKAWADNDKYSMFNLIFFGSKITFFLNWIFTLPMILNMDIILKVWLIKPPPMSSTFAKLALVEVLLMSLSLPLLTAARAPGKMKMYELSLGLVQLMILPISWLVLTAGYSAISVYVVAILAVIIMFVIRLYILKILIQLPVFSYLKNVGLPVFYVIFSSVFIIIMIDKIFSDDLFNRLLSITVSGFVVIISMYLFGLNSEERIKIIAFGRRKFLRK